MMDDERSEYELALRARAGHREALAELVERMRLRLFTLAYAELRHYENAQDAVASALLQICLHVGELRQPERIRAWMQRIVRNEVHRLRRGLGPSPLGLESLEAAETPFEEAAPTLLRMDIDRALRRLPVNQAQAIRLFYLEELSMGQIARRLGCSRGTLGSWLHRGRRHLATMMEGYAPMTPREQDTAPAAEPSRTAALIHTDLEPALVQQVTDALQTAGYRTKIITHSEFHSLTEALKECQVVILDEGREGRSALEYLVHIRANPEIKEIPVNVLCSDPADFTISAYFIAGVARLFRKDDPSEIARLARQLEHDGVWGLFTERARRIVHLAREEAMRLDENFVGTEHLLLGLARVPESVGARLLVERFGLSLESLRAEIDEQAIRGSGYGGGELQLSPRGKRVIDLAVEEARRLRNNYIGAEHLRLGLLREGYGLAARVLTNHGVDFESARRAVEALQVEALQA
jgi:RNA polymerase sigma factor (sigma-70 family)